ncbi:MAG TPA: GntR family transcriptional regulator [Blastocatellia bacterium]|nr:GntR family transcriptional regulator [Blastocatellia bacterium]
MQDFFQIDTSDPMPIYAQLERAIRFAILTGRLQVGEQLPTVRQLAVELRINANTVAKVYLELERAGILETRRGIGTFVRAEQFEVARRGFDNKAERERELRALADHYLAEAARLGYAPEEAINFLKVQRSKEKKTYGRKN